MENSGKDSDKKVQMKVYIRPELLEKLKYLHQKEGIMSQRTGKRKPFSTFISCILGDHVTERMLLIKALKESEWKDEDFD